MELLILFQFLVNSNPEKYGWLMRYYDEVYLCLNAVIQQHYIRCYGKIGQNHTISVVY